jgi:hypothetical protein
MTNIFVFFCLPVAGILCLVCVVFVLREYAKKNRAQVAGWLAYFSGYQATTAPVEMKKDKLAATLPSDDQSLTVDQKLQRLSNRQTVRLIEGELSVVASVELQPMWQRIEGSGPWEPFPKRKKCTALSLTRSIWVFKIPKKEQGENFWLKGSLIDEPPNLMSFFKGTVAAPGPARKFRMNGQTDPVPFKLSGDRKNAWKVVDIGTFGVTVDGSCHELETGDIIYFVTAKTDDGKWLLFLNARKGEAAGTGGLYLLEEFEPETEVMDLL